MSEIILWRKQEMDRLRRDMDQLLRRFRRSFGIPRALAETAETFGLDLTENADSLTLRADLSGIDPKDIELAVSEDSLTLKGETRENRVDQGADFRRVEESRHSFSRRISLPCRIMPEEVRASFKDGKLEIVLPKCKPKGLRGITIDVQ